MKKVVFYILFFAVIVLPKNNKAQCNLSIDTVIYNGDIFITPDTIKICLGDQVTFNYSNAGCPVFMMNNNFNNGTIGSGWSSNANPMFNNPCGPGPDGTTYLWIGPATSFPRRLTTVGFQVTTQCQICFDMKYATQGQSSPCEGPDEPTEGVHLQYSTNGPNGPWIDINYWNPNGGYDPNLTTWKNYCENVPVNGTVWFSWYQDVTSGNNYDHWGLDNVEIFCPPPNQVLQGFYQGNLVSNNVYSTTITPQSSGYFTAIVSADGNSAKDSVYVSVYPPPNMTINGLNNSYCVTDPPVNISGSPVPGEFSGPGITGNTFNPSVAGVGNHVITYHHYYVTTNTATGLLTIFYDDFSTDKGWTGYGTQWSRGPAVASTGCSGSQDPSLDYTPTPDNYIIGNWIGGCYQNNMNQTFWLTSPVINCANMSQCSIEFYSHSGVESPTYDKLYIQAYNGTTWQQVWVNTAVVNETSWTLKTYPVPQANNNPNFRVRFGIGPTDGSIVYKGWNIDDFKVKCQGTITVTDTLCDFITTQNVTVLSQPTSTFTYIDSICVNSTTTIQYTGNAPQNATFNWNFGGGTVISGSGSGPYVVQYSNDGDYNISLTVIDNGCSSTTTTHTLTVLPNGHPYCCILPNTNAGSDNSVCGMTYSLNAIPSVGTGTWSLISGPGNSQFQNINSPTSSVTVTQQGTYLFQWAEFNGVGCENKDTVAITFIQQPIAEAGQNINLCALNTSLNAIPSVGTGTWSQVSGPGTITFNDVNNPQTTISTNVQGTYLLQWTENNNGCTSSDQVTVTLTQQPVANAGIDASLCSYTYTMTAVPSVGTGMWTMIQGTGTAQFANAQSPTTNVQVNTHGTYTFVWTENNGNGCISSDTVQITFNYVPTSTFTVNPILCFGDTVVVTYTGNALPTATFSWTFNNANVISGTGAGPFTINYNQPGNYNISLQITQNGCQSQITTVSITNPQQLSLSLSKQDVSCFGLNDGLISSIVQGGTMPYNYLWNTGATVANLTQITAGNYQLTVTDANGCKVFDNIIVNEPAKLSIDMLDSIAVCKDTTITITTSITGGTFPYSYLWNNGFTSQNITVTPSQTTIYTLQVTDSKNCTATKSIKVYVFPPIVLSASANIDSVCLGEKVTITTNASGGKPPYTYYVNNLQTSIPIHIYPSSSQSYQIMVKDGCNYSAIVNIPIFVYPSPSINPSSNVIAGCAPLTVQFNEGSPDEGQTYIWNFGDNSSAFSKNPLHTFKNPGTYTITITTITQYGCQAVNVFPNWITVYPLPKARFLTDPTIATVIKPEVHFINISTLADSVMWFFGDGDSSKIYSPFHKYPAFQPQKYNVTLIVYTNKGCSDTTYGVVEVRDVYTFYAPSAFSPDGDGVNEVFRIYGHGINVETFNMKIYDRWGEIVFETNDINLGWDGRIKNGQIAPVGTYTWIVRFKDEQNIVHEEYGKVNIIR